MSTYPSQLLLDGFDISIVELADDRGDSLVSVVLDVFDQHCAPVHETHLDMY